MSVLRNGLVLALLWPACTLGALDTVTPRQLPNGARLDWATCWFEPLFTVDAHCAHFFPSAPAATPVAQRVRLPVVVLASPVPDARASPLLYLPAGPGSATGLDDRGLRQWVRQLELARWPHELVLFDVRGAGLSRPRLDCPEIVAADRSGLGVSLTAAEDLRRLQAAARACQKRLRASGVRLADYAVLRQVQDAGELMALLGRSDWNLWGTSYGTRLALHVAREYPDRVRALVADSVYPPDANGLLEKPRQFAHMLDQLLAVCAQDTACAAAHPALGRQLPELMQRLAAKPLQLHVEKWPGLWRHRLALNDYRLLWLLFLDGYRPADRPRAPQAIAAALRGDEAPLLPLAENFIETLLDPEFSHGLYWSTVCAEDLPGVTRAAYLAEVARYPAVAAYLAPEWDLHVCHEWNSGQVPARFRAPVRTAVPALLLSGAHDPVTPAAWGERAAAALPRSRHFVFPGSSHAVTWENDCAMAFVWEFLENPVRTTVPQCWRELSMMNGR